MASDCRLVSGTRRRRRRQQQQPGGRDGGQIVVIGMRVIRSWQACEIASEIARVMRGISSQSFAVVQLVHASTRCCGLIASLMMFICCAATLTHNSDGAALDRVPWCSSSSNGDTFQHRRPHRSTSANAAPKIQTERSHISSGARTNESRRS